MDRPLPYLIGSQPFMEQDDVGLGDLSSDGNKCLAASSGTLHLLAALVYYTRIFFHCMCMIIFLEMSVDSDRDSVIDSEDDKAAVVRPFPSFTACFCNLNKNPKSHCIHLIVL